MRELELVSYFIGAWLGDGTAYIHDTSRSRVYIAGIDKEILTRAHFAVQMLFDRRIKPKFKLRAPQRFGGRELYWISWYDKELRDLLFTLTGNYKLHLPSYIWAASDECKLAMLAGLFDTDGTIVPDGRITFYGTRLFVAQVPYLLNSVGIMPTNIRTVQRGAMQLIIDVPLRGAIDAGFYFRCRRKQYRLEQAAAAKGLTRRYPHDWISELETGGEDYRIY